MPDLEKNTNFRFSAPDPKGGAMLRRLVFSATIAGLAVTGLTASTPAAGAPSCPNTVMMLGDSITAMMSPFQRLQDLLTQAGCATTHLVNAGVGGKASADAGAAAPFLINAVKPDLVVYMIGTNDDNNGFPTRYANSVQELRTANSAIKILASINQCPLTPPAPTWILMPSKNNAIYGADFDMAANKYKPNIIGFVSNDKIPSSLMGSDGFHPTPEAQGYIQENTYNAIAKTYGLPLVAVNARATGGSCT